MTAPVPGDPLFQDLFEMYLAVSAIEDSSVWRVLEITLFHANAAEDHGTCRIKGNASAEECKPWKPGVRDGDKRYAISEAFGYHAVPEVRTATRAAA